MLVSVLKSKIHRAVVTDAKVDYVGSITIDKELMEKTGILTYEKVLVASVDTGQRLETYVIEGEKGKRDICLNGAAAKLIKKGELVIIMAFGLLEQKEAEKNIPKVVHLDENNNILKETLFVKENDEC